ncbi:hypothetical protein [Paratractidigestivibacter sp.]|uniref:hypothetical protein n=1 Tax=Paratractidigestivibacter sp. TaxID=2847316 RepID=UPI002ABD83A2|nr:hypothetical protein [Paratractidigestivibacter sp.]
MSTEKKQTVGLVLCGITVVLEVITLVLYVMNANQSYYQDMNGMIAGLVAGALVCTAASFALAESNANLACGVVSDVLRVAAPAMLFYAAAVFVGARAQSLGQIFGSNLELGNDAAFAAGTQAIATIVVFMVAWLVSVVASFTKLGKRAI